MSHSLRRQRNIRRVKSIAAPRQPIERERYELTKLDTRKEFGPGYQSEIEREMESRAMPADQMPGSSTILERLVYKALWDLGYRPPDLDFQSSSLGARLEWGFGRQVADFAIWSLGIIIEVQGEYWHHYGDQAQRDMEREVRLRLVPRPVPWLVYFLEERIIRDRVALYQWLQEHIVHAGVTREDQGLPHIPAPWYGREELKPMFPLPETGDDWSGRSPVNYLINGGFEADATYAIGWIEQAGATATIVDGTLRINATAADNGVYQEVSGLRPSAVYTVVGRVNTGGNEARVFTANGEEHNLDETIKTATMTQFSGLCRASATGTLTVYLTAHTTGVNIDFDDVCLFRGYLAFPFVPNALDAWRHPTDSVLIDGGDIYAASITADKFAVIGTAGGARIQITPTGIEGYDATPTQTFDFATDGTFWFGAASGTNSLSWNGSTLTLSGAITIESGSGIANLTDAGDLATADDLDDVADGSTYNKTTVNEVTGAGRAYADIDANGNFIGAVDPAHTAPVAGGAGLYLGSDYLGYYSGTAWNAYIANDGKFQFKGDATNLVAWDGSTLSVKGAITVNSGSGGGWTIDATSIRNTGSTAMLRGAGNLAFGTTPPTDANTGTGLFIDATGLYGLNANTQEFGIETTTGRAKFGGGECVLDSSGIAISGDETSSETYNSIRWLTETDPPGGDEIAIITAGLLFGWAGYAFPEIRIDADPLNQFDYGRVRLTTLGSGHQLAQLELVNWGTRAKGSLVASLGSDASYAAHVDVYSYGADGDADDKSHISFVTSGSVRAQIMTNGEFVLRKLGDNSRPVFCIGNDTNTGLWQSAADNLDFSTGGTNRVNISSLGLTAQGLYGTRHNREIISGMVSRDLVTIIDHFSSGDVPSGHAWAGSPFSTPSVTGWNTGGTALTMNSPVSGARAFLYASQSIGHDTDVMLAARVGLMGGDGVIGVRLDDGTDNNYVEVILGDYNFGTYGTQRGTVSLVTRYRTGGGSVTQVVQTDILGPQSELYTLTLRHYPATANDSKWDGYAYLGGNPVSNGALIGISRIVQDATWTPTRRGVIFQNRSGGTGYSTLILDFLANFGGVA